MKFIAEVKEVKSKKSASLDMTYRVVLETSDPNLLALGALPPDITVTVEIESNEWNIFPGQQN